MYLMRVVSALTLLLTFILFSNKAFGAFQLNEVMSVDEQKRTGVSGLTDVQKKELESWLNNNFVQKTITPATNSLFLQQNMNGGAQLMFSDGSVYEVSPADRLKTTFWLTSINVTIQPSSDPDYPVSITNSLTGVTVSAKQIKAGHAS